MTQEKVAFKIFNFWGYSETLISLENYIVWFWNSLNVQSTIVPWNYTVWLGDKYEIRGNFFLRTFSRFECLICLRLSTFSSYTPPKSVGNSKNQPFWLKFSQNHPNSVSRKQLIVQVWLTPHFNQKVHFPISVLNQPHL